jgi:hypothetical protein
MPGGTYYQQAAANKAGATGKVTNPPKYPSGPSGIGTIPSYAGYGGAPGDPLGLDNPAERAAFARYIAGITAAGDPSTPSQSDVQGNPTYASTTAALANIFGSAPEPTFTGDLPGGAGTISGRGGGSGAGSAAAASNASTQLQLENLQQQHDLLALQQQQAPQLYQQQLAKFGIQEQSANQAYQQGLRGLNSSATAAGAFTAPGANQGRTDLSTALQEKLGTIGANKQTATLNEQYNEASLADQAKLNMDTWIAVLGQTGFFANQPAAAPAAAAGGKQIRGLDGQMHTVFPGDPNYPGGGQVYGNPSAGPPHQVKNIFTGQTMTVYPGDPNY